ncbi:MAG TPA: hypothetical protein VN228_12515, partial [Pyrinomonadaceae bacterium]|nr:hypothetical protein [Pyrinomonadaceae bacterium]
RFALLARPAEALAGAGGLSRAGSDKLSLAVTPAGGPGAIQSVLEPFARRGIDLRRVTSRPLKGRPWRGRLFLDFHVAATRGELEAALEESRGRAEDVRLLGLYPSASYDTPNLTKRSDPPS